MPVGVRTALTALEPYQAAEKGTVNIGRKVIHLIGEEVIHFGAVEVFSFGEASPPFRLWTDDESGRTGLWL